MRSTLLSSRSLFAPRIIEGSKQNKIWDIPFPRKVKILFCWVNASQSCTRAEPKIGVPLEVLNG